MQIAHCFQRHRCEVVLSDVEHEKLVHALYWGDVGEEVAAQVQVPDVGVGGQVVDVGEVSVGRCCCDEINYIS